jgi:CheY-like chemotaxis protein
MIKIMVVDDEQDVEALFTQKFRKLIRDGRLGFHFTYSGEEALAYLKGSAAADLVLILSDINMPGMSGLELLREIKAQFPHLRVFMITAYDDKEKHDSAMQFGAERYLTKPIDFDMLAKEVFSLKE